MTRAWTTSFLGFGAAALLLLSACQTGGTKVTSTTLPSAQAVTCTKCQITWVQIPTEGGKGRIVGYSAQKQMECPDCKDAVQNFFATGELKHNCKTCGDTMETCDTH